MKTNRPGGLTLTRAALDACTFGPGDLILDAGCGFGATVNLINGSGGITAVGLDRDLSRLAPARERCQDLNQRQKPGRAVAADLPLLPFRPGSFKGIFCECVLSLVPDKAGCLAGFYTVLAPGGTLVLSDLVLPEDRDPAAEGGSIDPPSDLLFQPATCLDGALTLAVLTAQVERAGFTVIRVEDHTRMLREMACEMVFEHGSLDRFWRELTGTDFPAGLAGRCRAGSLKPGYALVLAEKQDG